MRFHPMPLCHTRALRAAADTAALRRTCEFMIAESPHVSIHLDRLDTLEPKVRNAKPWVWPYDARARTEADGLFCAATNAAMNGGYWYRSTETGDVTQWQTRGSGSAALQDWLDAMREKRLLPGWDHVGIGPDAEPWRQAVAAMLEGLPYADHRRQVLEEFADPDRRAALDLLAAEVLAGAGLSVEFGHADRLADIYPAGFRSDPMRKKAILAFLLVANNMGSRGLPVTWNAGFPADYQLPRVCAWKGVLGFSSAVNAALRDPRTLMPIASEEVFHIRAATFVAVETLAERSGVPSWLVDGALFMGCRKDPAFLAEAPPAMRVDGTWF